MVVSSQLHSSALIGWTNAIVAAAALVVSNTKGLWSRSNGFDKENFFGWCWWLVVNSSLIHKPRFK